MVSIIIVNYFNEQLILNCLETFFKFHKKEDVEVLIINNGGELETIKNHFSEVVKIIHPEGNVGFSKANNLGIKNSKGKYLLFLNPDTYFISSIIHECILKFENVPRIGLLGCRLLNIDQSLQLSYHDGDQIFKKLWFRNPFVIKFFNGSKKAKSSIEKIKHNHAKDHDAPWLTGAFLLTSKELIVNNDLYWDEDYFMYWEDVELSYRTHRKGLKNFYFTGAELVHIGGSGENVSHTRFSMVENSKILFVQKTKGNFIKNLYISLLKLELRFEKYLNRNEMSKSSENFLQLNNELNYYDI